jgi:hypothetical protein
MESYDKAYFLGRLSEVSRKNNDLSGVGRELIALLNDISSGGRVKVGYVSGIITSDGKEHIDRNIALLKRNTSRIREAVDFPVFSAADIFHNESYDKFDGIEEHEWYAFWKNILKSGYVAEIFMTPRWEHSAGAKDEFAAAGEAGIVVNHTFASPDNPEPIDIDSEA